MWFEPEPVPQPDALLGGEFGRELKTLLEVPYPLIFLSTSEERRVVELLHVLAGEMHVFGAQWTCVQGLDLGKGLVEGTQSIELALHHASAVQSPCFFVFLEPDLSSRLVQRQIKELVPLMESRQQCLIVVSASPIVPDVLAHDHALLHVPLPSREAISKVIAEVLPPASFPILPRERLVAAAMGLTVAEAKRAYRRAAIAETKHQGEGSFDWEACVLDEKRRAIGANDVAEFIENQEDLDTVGGMTELKEWLETRSLAFTQEARDFGLPTPKGLLLAGVQGCGKSLLAKAVARHWGLPLLRMELGAIFAGNTAPDAALHKALRIAEALAPSVLWVDEIEKGFGPSSDPSTTRVLGSMLTWLQEKTSEVFFVATANEVADLPPELLRKGRFDELFFVDLPDKHARAQVFAIHIRKRGRSPGSFDIAALAEASERYSGAEIEQVVVAGLYEAFAEGRELAQADLMNVMAEMVPLYATREGAIKKLREWAKTRARHASSDTRLTDYFGA